MCVCVSTREAKGVVQLAKCFPRVHEALGSVPDLYKLGVEEHTQFQHSGDGGRRLRSSRLSSVHSELGANLSYMKPYLNNIQEIK